MEHEKNFELVEAISEETKRFEIVYLWLKKSMPSAFFQEVSQEWVFLIVHSLMGFKVQDFFSEIHLKNAAISLCLDHPKADVSILENFPLHGIKNYTTYVSKEAFPEANAPIRIATILFTDSVVLHEALALEEIKKQSPHLPEEPLKQFDTRFLQKLPQEQRALALELFVRSQSRDHCQYEIHMIKEWKENACSSVKLLLAWRNTPKHNFLYRFARVVFQHGLIMQRVNATYINPYTTKSILMLSLELHGSDGRAAWEVCDLDDFLKEIATLKYFGSLDTFESTFVETKLLRGNITNLLRTMMNFIHQVLVHANPHLYNLENIEEALCRHPELTVKLCSAFESKFNPKKVDLISYEKNIKEFQLLVNQLDTGHEFHDLRRKNILLQGLNFVENVLKTNFYKTNKTAFSFRLDPKYLDATPFERSSLFPEIPYGIFFIKGMHFLSFHIRFKDLARGGLRTIFPEKKEKMLAERNMVFAECYNLAYTQHKKNKDIPEGGAKGVIFLKPYERLHAEAEIYRLELSSAGYSSEEIENKIFEFKEEQKKEYLYETQRSFIKNFLVLINCDESGALKTKDVIDYYQKPEYIYLGPDENLHNVMIDWIAKESKKEGYRPAGAFISGKPEVGINHKEYGVTSLGVNVYMHEALKYLHIDPKKDLFTVKITGGPDGDVAGNQIFNLYRYYPKTAKLVAITDVSGTIHDPHGLDLEACVQLFKEQKPIRFYPPEKLSSGGFLVDKETKKEIAPYVWHTLCLRNIDGKIVREWLSGNDTNSLLRHNVHQTQADVFIPCGGRPRTLNETNVEDFLDKTLKPTSKAIIEGANLYLSNEARHFLENKGVIIFKDSSANKCGVICSSFEILCSLTLNDEEFLTHKHQLVKEILERLRECAYHEARLLLKTYNATKSHLSTISDEISRKINLYTDQLLNHLDPIELSNDPLDPLLKCFLEYCPSTLKGLFLDKLITNIPQNHKKAIIASHIASKLVYTRGLDWEPTLVDILPLILEDEKIIGTQSYYF